MTLEMPLKESTDNELKSISPTFYAQLFAPIFLRTHLKYKYKKAAHKMYKKVERKILVKLTPGLHPESMVNESKPILLHLRSFNHLITFYRLLRVFVRKFKNHQMSLNIWKKKNFKESFLQKKEIKKTLDLVYWIICKDVKPISAILQ